MFLFANLAEICFNAKDAISKDLMGNRGVNLVSLGLLNALFNLILVALTIMCEGKSVLRVFTGVCYEDRMILLIQGVMGCLTSFLVYSGFLALPMTIFMIILGTLPFASGILAYIFLGETMDCYTINTMAVCFGAIALLACADDSDTDLKEVSDRSAQKYNSYSYIVGVIFALGSVLTIACIMIISRKL